MIAQIEVGSRPATSDDLAVLTALSEESSALIADVRGGRMESLLHGRGAQSQVSLRADLEDPDTEVLAGTVDGAVVGVLVLRLRELVDGSRIGLIDDLFVRPAARRVGVGERLLLDALDIAKQHGCSGVDSRALPGDRATKNFFESFGLVARSIHVHRELPAD